MVDITATLKNISINPNITHDNNSLKECNTLVIECLEEVENLRKKLTQAYILNQTIVIEENGQYILTNETKVREEKRQSKDINEILSVAA